MKAAAKLYLDSLSSPRSPSLPLPVRPSVPIVSGAAIRPSARGSLIKIHLCAHWRVSWGRCVTPGDSYRDSVLLLLLLQWWRHSGRQIHTHTLTLKHTHTAEEISLIRRLKAGKHLYITLMRWRLHLISRFTRLWMFASSNESSNI